MTHPTDPEPIATILPRVLQLLRRPKTEPKGPPMARLWNNTDGVTEGKYLVQRRDGTVPPWPYFVIAASDPAAPPALRAYADAAKQFGMDPDYVADLHELASKFERWRTANGQGDPDAPRHRRDNPATVALMRGQQAS